MRFQNIMDDTNMQIFFHWATALFILQAENIFYLELLHAGHVVAEHAVLQHGDGVTLTTDFLDLLTCTVAERERLVQGCCRDALIQSCFLELTPNPSSTTLRGRIMLTLLFILVFWVSIVNML